MNIGKQEKNDSNRSAVAIDRDCAETVMDILELVRTSVCDNYCKWPLLLACRPEDELLEQCGKCPLNRL